MAFLAAGCFGNKNKDVAVNAPAPPPAAYPDTSAAMGAATGGAMSAPAAPSAPSNAMMAATNRPSAAQAPAPFSLREGEQLVPHQVQSGENLSSIATRYNTSVSRIQSANGMTDTKIYAGKSIQVPTSAPPANLGQGAAAASGAAPYGSVAPVASTIPTQAPVATGAYPGTTSAPAPSAPVYPSISSSSGAISAPPVPTGAVSAVPPGYPATTSYPRTAPTPSFEGSRVQFSN